MKSKESIVLGGGCFWCLEASYKLIKGVTKVVSGYSGGNTTNPTMNQVYSGTTGHAEVVMVEYDPNIITLEDLLSIFWTIHDPTSVNRQGNDVGEEYRSVIFYNDDKQKEIIEDSKEKVKSVWEGKIVTQILKLQKFYPADDDQQSFYEKHPDLAYCQIVINPKLNKLREKFTKLMV